jgi:cytochrome c-type biogenesis protein CcmH
MQLPSSFIARCEEYPFDVCPTQACAQWRELIREKLADGWDEQQIKDYFVEQYGERVLGAPPARGINWLAYIIPPLAILGGLLIVVRALRSWKVAAPTTPIEQQRPSLLQMSMARLEDELRKR